MKEHTYIEQKDPSVVMPIQQTKTFLSPWHLLNILYQFAKSQAVLTIATIAMVITCIFVPVDGEYLGYFNMRTLATLYCTLAVVSAFSHIHVFEIISKNIVLKLHNLRNATLGLVFITFVGSMLLANDMALLTFLPLGFFVLNSTDHKEAMAFTFIMQNIAANLGGMVTPFGNPQNLYLYSYFHIDTMEFITIMLPSFLAATVLIVVCCLFVKPTPLSLKKDEHYALDKQRTTLYSILFIASILIVFRVFPFTWGTLLITLALLYLDKDAIKEVNYPLLATFCVFFVFSGNMARIPAVREFFEFLLPKNTLLFGILSCQFISNVPSAVLLSHFTSDYASLLPAVNIGGCGTLIASLASLITFTEFKKHNPEKVKGYIVKFSAINFGFVIVLYLLQLLIQ
ncbi:SLC13 family permease [Anaerosporobacter faecicola]|uniref:SLC13 family permease n=1 Tax=Anaerosporobacter faecicola TaxID=2718714 RepID=UPI001EE5353C|nr:SLC13 family permease [Anaerosporobacter faecicola]